MRWLSLLYCISAALAQSEQGTIRGSVVDHNDGVPSAPIQAKNILTGALYKAASSRDGSYSLDQLPPGKYEVTINVAGFEKHEVTVQSGQVSAVDFRFQPDFQLGTLGDGDVYSRIAQFNRPPPPLGATPRTADGKPDLSGVWRAPTMIDSKEPALLPKAQQLLNERFENNGLDSPAVRCMPDAVLRLSPFFKLIQTASVLMVVIEAETPGYYQVFLDGRGHPKDSYPTWYGHSIGKWDGDTLVVDTVSFNERRWLTVYGTPISAKLHLTQRFQRTDLGHLQIETTIDDPDIYPQPWTTKQVADLAAGEEIMESICNENNKDPQHMVGK